MECSSSGMILNYSNSVDPNVIDISKPNIIHVNSDGLRLIGRFIIKSWLRPILNTMWL